MTETHDSHSVDICDNYYYINECLDNEKKKSVTTTDSGGSDNYINRLSLTGSHKEEDIFAHLTPEEATARLEKILDKIDTNNDKLISREEIAHHVMHSF